MFALITLGLLQDLPPIKEQYDKLEMMIPMRDGVKLYTAVYVPKDRSGQYPMMMMRTPYSAGPYGTTQFRQGFPGSANFRKNNYIFVFQDVRGKYMSEGDFVNVRPQILNKVPKDVDESTDTWDTVQYLLNNVPANNGRVGVWGISYPGFYAGAAAIDTHPALKAASPQAPVSDWWIGDDFHHLGAFFLQDAFTFFNGFGQPRPSPTATPRRGPAYDLQGDAYKFFLDLGPLSNVNAKYFKGEVEFWNQMMAHGHYDDFWKARALPPHMTGVKAAVLVVGGLFDAEDLWGAWNLYRYTNRLNPEAKVNLVMGPWPHGGWAGGTGSKFGDIDMPGEPSAWYRENIEWPFFDSYLRGDGKVELPEATVYDVGQGKFLTFDQWPPKEVLPSTLYFREDEKLDAKPPESASGNDAYVSDPAKPVPYQGGALTRRTATYMIDDQRFAEARPDVLTYRTDPLEADITWAGPVTADLRVSTTGTDADFVVKIIDVYPPDAEKNSAEKPMGDYQMLVRAEVIRAKYRKDFSKPVPFVPGQIDRVKFDLPDVLHTFRKGHRIMVQVQSSWFPLVDRNPQKFCDIYSAKEEDFKPATISLFRTKEQPSGIMFSILPKK